MLWYYAKGKPKEQIEQGGDFTVSWLTDVELLSDAQQRVHRLLGDLDDARKNDVAIKPSR